MWDNLLNFWEDRTLLRDIIKEHPHLGPFLFVLLQALQVVIAPLPGEVTGFMAGFLFGAFWGFVLSVTGIFLGSALVFLLVRSLRKHFLSRYEGHPFYLKVKKLFKKFGLSGVFFLYLFPGFPKDLVNYLMPFMPISLKAFLIVSTLGRAPGTLALSIQGDVVYGGHPYKILIVTATFLLAFFIFILLRKRLENYLNNS
jgi:uncharacterized membrane protein YdjX (TVP38/TMEM64 family)